jgi:hypothetical protein
VKGERDWWLRTLAVVVDPRPTFSALRSEEQEDVEARAEPLLAIVWLAGIAWLLADPVAGTLFDDENYDWLVFLIWAFLGGGAVGLVGYFTLGWALQLGLRALGSTGSYLRARHLLAFAAVPFVASIAVFAVKLALFGADTLRSGGGDEGTAGTVLTVLQLALAGWSAVLLLVGVHTVEGWSWLRTAASLAVVAVFAAALAVLASWMF